METDLITKLVHLLLLTVGNQLLTVEEAYDIWQDYLPELSESSSQESEEEEEDEKVVGG